MSPIASTPLWSQTIIRRFIDGSLPQTVEALTVESDKVNLVGCQVETIDFLLGDLVRNDEQPWDTARGKGVVQLDPENVSYYEQRDGQTEIATLRGSNLETPDSVLYSRMENGNLDSLQIESFPHSGQVRLSGLVVRDGNLAGARVFNGWALAQ